VALNWIRGGNYYLKSDPEGFVINRANTGGRICYMAVKLGTPWRGRPGDTEPRGWDGSTILHVERDLDPADDAGRLAALDRCKAACEAAHVR
jgi:hypothetical protein